MKLSSQNVFPSRSHLDASAQNTPHPVSRRPAQRQPREAWAGARGTRAADTWHTCHMQSPAAASWMPAQPRADPPCTRPVCYCAHPPWTAAPGLPGSRCRDWSSPRSSGACRSNPRPSAPHRRRRCPATAGRPCVASAQARRRRSAERGVRGHAHWTRQRARRSLGRSEDSLELPITRRDWEKGICVDSGSAGRGAGAQRAQFRSQMRLFPFYGRRPGGLQVHLRRAGAQQLSGQPGRRARVASSIGGSWPIANATSAHVTSASAVDIPWAEHALGSKRTVKANWCVAIRSTNAGGWDAAGLPGTGAFAFAGWHADGHAHAWAEAGKAAWRGRLKR
jgi:hypothetical protein